MVLVSLAWALLGAAIGLIAAAAHLAPGGRWAPWSLALVGAGAALAGGWLAVPLWGSIFATSAALWIAVVVAVALPYLREWGAALLSSRRGSRAPTS